MSQPAPFNRSFSFSNFQAANRTEAVPGSQIDLELNNAKSSIDGVLTNLALIQRDDGALKSAARFSAVPDAQTLGAKGGATSQNTTLITANLPAYTPSGSVTVNQGVVGFNPFSPGARAARQRPG